MPRLLPSSKIKTLIMKYYREESARANWWDYSGSAAYFITICTKDRRPYFGSVVNGIVKLSDVGEIIENCWKEIPVHFPFANVDDFVIMPDHMHGIIIINSTDAPPQTHNKLSGEDIPTDSSLFMSSITPVSKSLPNIVASFKSAATRLARVIQPDFAWQPRYHDRIIRNQIEHARKISYMKDNPINWKGNRFLRY